MLAIKINEFALQCPYTYLNPKTHVITNGTFSIPTFYEEVLAFARENNIKEVTLIGTVKYVEKFQQELDKKQMTHFNKKHRMKIEVLKDE